MRKAAKSFTIRKEKIGDGYLKVGNGPGYLVFTPSGDVQILRESDQAMPEKKTALKHFDAYDSDGQLKSNISILINLRVDPALPEEVQDILRRLETIMRAKEDFSAERLIDGLAHDLRAARKVLGSNQQAIAPHDTFRIVLARLARKLGRGKTPTKAQIRKALNEVLPTSKRGYKRFSNTLPVSEIC
jgi:hypothetical protein